LYENSVTVESRIAQIHRIFERPITGDSRTTFEFINAGHITPGLVIADRLIMMGVEEMQRGKSAMIRCLGRVLTEEGVRAWRKDVRFLALSGTGEREAVDWEDIELGERDERLQMDVVTEEERRGDGLCEEGW
jgi:hypothetical protein